jgi:hypothetical protein
MYKGIQESLSENMLKSVFLVVAFPLLLWVVVVAFFFLVPMEESVTLTLRDAMYMANNAFLILGPLIIIWGIISFFFHRRMIFRFS